MKIIFVVFLFGYACGSAIPKPVHPNADLIAAQSLTSDKIRIVGGSDTVIHLHKWQVSLQKSGSHMCGAVIISDHYAVTAAHCVDGSSAGDLQIGVGSTNWRFGEKYSVTGIIKHENYGSGSGFIPNDIALLKFDDVITSGSNAAKVALPDDSSSGDYNNCIISGWGRTSGNGPVPNILQAANTTVLSNSRCTASLGNNFNKDVHVCIRNGETGSCNGDSGGPLTCNDGELVGVTSWGMTGCSVSYPSVYTRISTFRDWIWQNSGV